MRRAVLGKVSASRSNPPLIYVRARFGGTVTVNRLRPLALLRFRTFLPPGVAIRTRNPCVLLRLKLLG